MGAPSKAKVKIGHQLAGRPEDGRDAPKCAQCQKRCSPGTFIYVNTAEDGDVVEEVYVCSRECFLDWIEEELVDDRVERAVRDERAWLHEKVCPACQRRLKKCAEAGEAPK